MRFCICSAFSRIRSSITAVLLKPSPSDKEFITARLDMSFFCEACQSAYPKLTVHRSSFLLFLFFDEQTLRGGRHIGGKSEAGWGREAPHPDNFVSPDDHRPGLSPGLCHLLYQLFPFLSHSRTACPKPPSPTPL